MTYRKVSQKKSNSLKRIWGLIISLAFLVLVIVFLLVFFKLFKEPNQTSRVMPAKILNISEPFSGEVYLNDQLGGTLFSDQIIAAIDGSKKSLEIAVYSMDNTSIRDAVYRAAKRGVKASLIFSDKQKKGHDAIFKDLPKNVSRLDISSDIGYMHHKFLLVDRGEAGAKLFFGSYNFTYLQEKYDPSFLLETARPEIIEVFGEEFDRLAASQHGTMKLDKGYNPFAALIKYPEGFLEIWFSPQRTDASLKQRMIDLVRESKSNIKIMIWNFTDNVLAGELAAAASRETVSIITDDVNYSVPESALNLLLAEKTKHHLSNLTILTDVKRNNELRNRFQINDLNSFLHHHLLLIDDRIAVFGTNNWSAGGFYKNDESIMISDIPSIVSSFESSFDFNHRVNK